MRFSLVIQSAPYADTASARALATAEQLLQSGHEIERLFFYQDGVFNAGSQQVPAQQLPDIPAAWQVLIETNSLDAVVCVSSALQRGILTKSEASRYEKGSASMLAGFTLGGLGLLVETLASADRVLTFG